jgi:hypothetical protein
MVPVSARALLCLVAATFVAASSSNAFAASALHATDLQGKVVEQLAPRNARFVVLIFAATDCPISKRYVPEIARIEQEFTTQGVAVWWVFPNPGDTAVAVRKHELDFSIHSATLIDSRQELVHLAHVSVTPEAAVFAVNGAELREIYHGRIDDRYLSFSRFRPAATRHDLEDAIRAALAGQPVAASPGGPVGCSIVPISPPNQKR